MNKQLKLTWRYFIQNKIKEIIWTIVILTAIIFIPYLLGNSIGDNRSSGCDWDCGIDEGIDECNPDTKCGKIIQWFEGAGYLIGGIFVLSFVGWIIYCWFSSNWEKANNKDRKELKTSHKRRSAK